MASESAPSSSSLLSLSLAAAQSDPLPPLSPAAVDATPLPTNGKMKTRRLSSASSTRRRMNDAREANIRNSTHSISGLSNAAAALSLSSSPPQSTPLTTTTTTSSIASSLPTLPTPRVTTHAGGHQSLNGILSVGALETIPPPSSTIIGSKKKGTIFRCEACSKVYRHPSCLVKHRWEHSPHWKEANKFLLSKHQQVQLLEAAAILSHITPSGGAATSLPDDRSLWPSYLSTYVPPKELTAEEVRAIEEDEGDDDDDVVDDVDEDDMEMEMEFESVPIVAPVSSSVPATVGFGRNGYGVGPGIGERVGHRSRSRSRSVSKSIHRNVLLSVRGLRRDRDELVDPPPAAPAMTTLRPGLIAVPVKNDGAARGRGEGGGGDIWSTHRSSPSWSSSTTTAMSTSTPAPIPTTYNSSLSLSLPRSSLRSSSSFLETDEPQELLDEDEEEAYSDDLMVEDDTIFGGKKKNKESEVKEWDGEEMEMELGF